MMEAFAHRLVEDLPESLSVTGSSGFAQAIAGGNLQSEN
jgi:hypothetical protein